MSEKAKLSLPDGQSMELPVLTGTRKEKAIDISNLRKKTGHITLDPGFVNTGSCESAITFLDGENGVLQFRGYPIEQLAAKSTFLEVSYLLIHGELPNKLQLEGFIDRVSLHSMIHEDMRHFFDGFSQNAHPMVILSSMISSLSAYYVEASGKASIENLELNSARLIAKVTTIAAFAYKKSVGQPFVYPKDELSYCANFLNMMFAVPAETYKLDHEIERTLDLLLISKYIEMAKNQKSDFRLMGFGHRVYKNIDPRARILKDACDRLLKKTGTNDPLLEIALKLEETALSDDYFIERKLFPTLDFYTGIIYRAIGIPINMFTVMFALGRVPGWIAQWKEMHEDPKQKIARPRQLFIGQSERSYKSIDDRL